MRPEEMARFETLTLEKAKVAAIQMIGSQVADSMGARVMSDFAADNLVVRLQSEVLSHRDGTDEQQVYSEVEVLPYKWHVLGLSVPLALLGAVLLLFGLHLFAAVSFLMAFVVSFAYVASRDVKARKPFVVKAERWVRFPENTMAYPTQLGPPVIQIVVRAEEQE